MSEPNRKLQKLIQASKRLYEETSKDIKQAEEKRENDPNKIIYQPKN